VNDGTPAELSLDRQVLTVLKAVLRAAAPEEGCALLVGEPDPWRLRRVWPCLNVWEPARERRRRFALDPREQLQAQKWARARGLSVLGSAHSHPQSPPLPSELDRRLAFPPTLLLILGLPAVAPGVASAAQAMEDAMGEEPGLACWWLPEQGEPRRLAWRMVD
jgi:proteasome lid subunit RPN8/RPN11